MPKCPVEKKRLCGASICKNALRKVSVSVVVLGKGKPEPRTGTVLFEPKTFRPTLFHTENSGVATPKNIKRR